jgi:hypothetical protein
MEMENGRAHHPQCHSQAEVANKTIAKYLKMLSTQVLVKVYMIRQVAVV